MIEKMLPCPFCGRCPFESLGEGGRAEWACPDCSDFKTWEEWNTRAEIQDKRDFLIDNLAMLVRRLCYQSGQTGTRTSDQAMEFLKKYNLQGSPIRLMGDSNDD